MYRSRHHSASSSAHARFGHSPRISDHVRLRCPEQRTNPGAPGLRSSDAGRHTPVGGSVSVLHTWRRSGTWNARILRALAVLLLLIPLGGPVAAHAEVWSAATARPTNRSFAARRLT